ncbi:endo alpha-1,4 polygalactosaminidase [Candidatus Micrarchaeota archaeon]|nr:endo alpha-1,4 polygalactosaminidase [Candidatus Micrarchaeota archaeon]
MRRRGQGTFEYVLLLGGVLLIVVLAIVVLQNTFNQSTQGISEIEMKKCKAAAGASPACFAGSIFQPSASFSSWEVPEGTLCDCSNFNPDALPGGSEPQTEFSRPSTLYFADSAAVSPAPATLTRPRLIGDGKRLRLVLQHFVSSTYSGPLRVVLPVSKDRVQKLVVMPFSQPVLSESLDGSGLTVLKWDQFHPVNKKQLFIVIAYLKPADRKQVESEIRSKIPKVTAARPAHLPEGFDEYVHPGVSESSLTCLPEGSSCANPFGPACCSGLACDAGAFMSCKKTSLPTPLPVPTSTPMPILTATPIPTSTPTALPSPTPTRQPSACVQARGQCVSVFDVSDVYRNCVRGNDAALDASCGVDTYCCVPRPSVFPTASPIPTATPAPVPTSTATPSPTASPSATPAPGAYVACGANGAGMCYKTVSYNTNNNHLGCPLGLQSLAENGRECSNLGASCCKQPPASSCESVEGLCIGGQPFYPDACSWPEFGRAPASSTGSCSPNLLCCKPSPSYQVSAAVKILATPMPVSTPTPTLAPTTMPTSTPTPTASPTPSSDLRSVKTWAYQLTGYSAVDSLSQLKASSAQLVVIDAFSSTPTTKFTASQIQELKSAGKKVVAYMSIGEAENYRYYWKTGWTTGNPAWLGRPNSAWSQGGSINAKVRYWDPQWQAVILGDGGYLDQIVGLGFDGVYLDIVDAYEYWSDPAQTAASSDQPVAEIAFSDSSFSGTRNYLDENVAAERMLLFIKAIRDRARKTQPSFVVIPQNAPQLVNYRTATGLSYTDVLDAIGKEDTWYTDYGTTDSVTQKLGTTALLRSTPDGLGSLRIIKAAGKPVFSVDYFNPATDSAKVSDYCAKAAVEGFVAYPADARNLDDVSRLTCSPIPMLSPTPSPSLGPETFTLTLHYGSNFVSVPLFDSKYVGGTCVFDGKDVPAWHFNGQTYDSAGKFSDKSIRLEAGKGYWVSSNNKQDCTAVFSGTRSFSSYGRLALRGGGNPPKSYRGWNMVGALSKTASFGQVRNDCKMISGLFGYVPSGGSYEKVDVLQPGRGYWVFVENDCFLDGDSSSPVPSPTPPISVTTPELPALPSVGTPTPAPSPGVTIRPTILPTVTPVVFVTPTPVPEVPKVCASYFSRKGSAQMVQGTWADDPQITATRESCLAYMTANILSKPYCAQPDGQSILIALIPKSKFSFELPVLTSEEKIYSQVCLQPSPSPSPSPTAIPTPNCLVQLPFLQIGCQPIPTPTPLPSPTAAPMPASDTLVFSTGQTSFQTSATDTATVDLSYVLVQSSLDAPFDFGTVKTRSFYYVTDSKPAGKAVQGMVFYRDPTTSNFVPYIHPGAVRSSDGRVSTNFVPYSYGTQRVDIRFNADGINLGPTEPDFMDFVIFVPDGPGGPSFQIDVGYGDQSTPRLGSSTQSGVAYG